MDFDADLEAFAASLAELPLTAARLRVLEECHRVDQAMARHRRQRRGTPVARKRYGTYRERLSGLSSWMFTWVLPRGPILKVDYAIYQHLAQGWVRRGDVEPRILELFEREE